LRIVKVTNNSGWTNEVRTPSGTRVVVKFKNASEIVRFAASMNSKGSEIKVKTANC
jgi:hypothetical protein